MSESSKVQEYKQAGNRENKPPKHEAVYFKGLMSEKRAFGDFRTVLHTGLYSQIVAMEVPVGGDIGDEVRSSLCQVLGGVELVWFVRGDQCVLIRRL
jgi:putative ABC transport system ATP-binding protein